MQTFEHDKLCTYCNNEEILENWSKFVMAKKQSDILFTGHTVADDDALAHLHTPDKGPSIH